MAAARPRDLQPSSNAESPAAVSTVKLEAALKKVSAQAAQYEHQMKDVESQLAESLSNFRAIDSLLQEAFSGLRRNAQRADHALGKQVSHITLELDSSMVSLKRLADELPTIQAQVDDIRTAYDSGRNKAQSLLTDLTWLNTEFYERWRYDHLHFVQPCFMALESAHATRVRHLVRHVHLVDMDHCMGRLPGSSWRTNVGRKTDVL
ncbi:hypothetical protein R3P38DRAFT_3088822, partial [Favolaschia claudopus]